MSVMLASARSEARCYLQACNQLGTPGGAKSFPRGAQIFKTMSNSFKLCPTHFSGGEAKKNLGVV